MEDSSIPATTKPPGDEETGEFSDVEIQENQNNSIQKLPENQNNPNPNHPTTPDSSASQKPQIPHIKPQPQILHNPPPDLYPQPTLDRSQSVSISDYAPSIGKYISERSNSFSAAVTNRLASLRDPSRGNSGEFTVKNNSVNLEVTDFKIPGVKVILKIKSVLDEDKIRGRVTFYSRSNCRDCTAVRTLLRQKGLNFVEINVDVYVNREKELKDKTGRFDVPQIFFNDKLIGGLVELNSLRNSGEFDGKLKEMLGQICPKSAPVPPPAAGDEEEEPSEDEMIEIARFLRQTMVSQDRVVKLTTVKNCFSGNDMLEELIQHMDCGRRKAIATAKLLAKKHFFHHVFGENEFETGNHFYRFLEQEPFITACFNYRNCTNDSEPMPAAVASERLMKLMCAMLETYATEDRSTIDYYALGKSEEFRRYINLARNLQRINLQLLSPDERLTFFLNLYNAMVVHATVSIGHPEGVLDKRAFFCDFLYVVGGYSYSLTIILNGILRHNQKPAYSWIKPFSNSDRRLELFLPKFNPIMHFGLCNGTRSSPTMRFFTPQGVESELKYATREFFQRGGIQIDLDKRTVYLSRIIRWYMVDFGQDRDILTWTLNFLDAMKAGFLNHLLSDGGPINIVYQSYDWSGNS